MLKLVVRELQIHCLLDLVEDNITPGHATLGWSPRSEHGGILFL